MRKHVGKWDQPSDIKLEIFEDTKGVIRIRKSKKDKKTNNDLQSTTQKTKTIVERELLTLPENLRSSWVFVGFVLLDR
jgi:hypothetical protein